MIFSKNDRKKVIFAKIENNHEKSKQKTIFLVIFACTKP